MIFLANRTFDRIERTWSRRNHRFRIFRCRRRIVRGLRDKELNSVVDRVANVDASSQPGTAKEREILVGRQREGKLPNMRRQRTGLQGSAVRHVLEKVEVCYQRSSQERTRRVLTRRRVGLD